MRRLRIPATDLLVPEHRSRLEDCAALGFQFTLFSFGYPNQRLIGAVRDAEGLIDTWEFCHIIEDLPNVVVAVCPVVTSLGVALYLSLIRTRKDQESTGGQYHHMIVHGFSSNDTTQISQIAQLPNVVGLVFRTEGGRSPWQQAHSVLGLCRSYGLKASLHISMTKDRSVCRRWMMNGSQAVLPRRLPPPPLLKIFTFLWIHLPMWIAVITVGMVSLTDFTIRGLGLQSYATLLRLLVNVPIGCPTPTPQGWL